MPSDVVRLSAGAAGGHIGISGCLALTYLSTNQTQRITNTCQEPVTMTWTDSGTAYSANYTCTGFYLLGSRLYDTSLGRFSSQDQLRGNVALPLSRNRSTYALNNPTTLTDPTGLTPSNQALNNGSGDNPCASTASGTLGGDVVNAACTVFVALGQAQATVQTDLGAFSLPVTFAAAPPPPGGGGGDDSRNVVPQKARTVLEYVSAHGGSAPPGYTGGRVFQNRSGSLPSGDYRECDVDPTVPGTRRNAERIVIDQKTGQAYDTLDHYSSFTTIP